MESFKIVNIKADGSVDVQFSVDAKTQNLSNLPIDNKDHLYDILREYGIAYSAGLSKSSIVPDKSIEKNVAIPIIKSSDIKETVSTTTIKGA